ncbi:hypothetical protein J6590_095738, partial [Homalodisca vitripennis]
VFLVCYVLDTILSTGCTLRARDKRQASDGGVAVKWRTSPSARVLPRAVFCHRHRHKECYTYITVRVTL